MIVRMNVLERKGKFISGHDVCSGYDYVVKKLFNVLTDCSVLNLWFDYDE